MVIITTDGDLDRKKQKRLHNILQKENIIVAITNHIVVNIYINADSSANEILCKICIGHIMLTSFVLKHRLHKTCYVLQRCIDSQKCVSHSYEGSLIRLPVDRPRLRTPQDFQLAHDSVFFSVFDYTSQLVCTTKALSSVKVEQGPAWCQEKLFNFQWAVCNNFESDQIPISQT